MNPGRTLRSYSVLVVEDEIFVRNMISMHLEHQGCQVLTAQNGKDAYSQMLESEPDAIICDILMPQEDGLAFCRRLRALGKKIPFLFLSGKTQSESVVEGLAAGADDYLVKPFDLDEMSARLMRLLERRSRH